MKTWISLLTIVLIFGCATRQAPVPGQTLVNGSPKLRKDAVRAVATYEMAVSAYKGPLPVIDTQIVEAPGHLGAEPGTELVKTKWIERWVIQRGSTNFAYKVMFDARGSRGTDITVGFDRPDFMKGPADVIEIK
jgi:hypothetical protein